MSELDFDELDKAVNTLMNDVPKVEPPKTDDVKTLTIKSTLPETTRPPLNNLDSALKQTNDQRIASIKATPSRPAAAGPLPVATRRGGRFMDVVHPSSTMKSAVPAAVRPASRQGVTIEPFKNATSKVEANTPDDASKTPLAVDVTLTTAAEKSDNSANTTKNEWPDPLDMGGYTPEPATSSSIDGQSVQNEGRYQQSNTTDDVDNDMSRPLDSPFLTDTKVEKRPLGGVATPASSDTTAEEPSHAPVLGALAEGDSVSKDSGDQLPVKPPAVSQQLPPELQSDLMAIETDGDTVATEEPKVETDVVKNVSVNTEQATATVKSMASPAVPASVVSQKAPIGPTSIAQQYSVEPTTSDHVSGSIFDTDSYHQPLMHPMKNKSGWLWVVWIMLLLLVGGSGAMALYFLDII